MHDKRRGALSLVRMLSGSLQVGAKVRTSAGSNEVVERIYEPLADEYKEITSVDRGNVAICSGLKVGTAPSVPFAFDANRPIAIARNAFALWP